LTIRQADATPQCHQPDRKSAAHGGHCRDRGIDLRQPARLQARQVRGLRMIGQRAGPRREGITRSEPRVTKGKTRLGFLFSQLAHRYWIKWIGR